MSSTGNVLAKECRQIVKFSSLENIHQRKVVLCLAEWGVASSHLNHTLLTLCLIL
jgi:hypothetical protein